MIRDAYELNDGDTVMVIKDLKVEGASLVVKGQGQNQRGRAHINLLG